MIVTVDETDDPNPETVINPVLLMVTLPPCELIPLQLKAWSKLVICKVKPPDVDTGVAKVGVFPAPAVRSSKYALGVQEAQLTITDKVTVLPLVNPLTVIGRIFEIAEPTVAVPSDDLTE